MHSKKKKKKQTKRNKYGKNLRPYTSTLIDFHYGMKDERPTKIKHSRCGRKCKDITSLLFLRTAKRVAEKTETYAMENMKLSKRHCILGAAGCAPIPKRRKKKGRALTCAVASTDEGHIEHAFSNDESYVPSIHHDCRADSCLYYWGTFCCARPLTPPSRRFSEAATGNKRHLHKELLEWWGQWKTELGSGETEWGRGKGRNGEQKVVARPLLGSSITLTLWTYYDHEYSLESVLWSLPHNGFSVLQ